jgi:dGTPase
VLDDPLPLATAEYIAGHDLELSTYAGPEAQVAALADDIAYDNHDIDDGLRAELFPADALAQVPQVAPVLAELRERYKNLSREQLAHETVRRLIGGMVDDVIGESRARLARANAARVEEIRALPGAVIAFSQAMTTAQSELKQFLFEQMYRHPRVNRMTERAGRVVRDLFGLYTAQPEHLPRHRGPNPPDTPRRVADFIAGMTDRFALEEHRRHFGDTT